MKKNMFIGITVILGMLISVNIYGYISNVKISKYIDESTTLREKMLVLDELRSSIVETSQTRQLLILTQKEVYKNSFDKNMKQLYSQIDDLYNKGYINKYEKEKLTYTINDYEQLSLELVSSPSSYTLDPQLEKQMSKFNFNELKILHEVTLDITSENEDFKSNNKNISKSSNIQNKLIQGVSSAITVLVSGFAYYFKTKFKIDDKEIEKIIDFLTNPDTENSPTQPSLNTDTSTLSNLSSISCTKDRVCENESLLTNANLLYKQSLKFKSQCDKSELILKDIDIYIYKLRDQLDDLDDYPASAQKIILDDMERQLYEFKILFKSLPNYNDFILDISKDMINKK